MESESESKKKELTRWEDIVSAQPYTILDNTQPILAYESTECLRVNNCKSGLVNGMDNSKRETYMFFPGVNEVLFAFHPLFAALFITNILISFTSDKELDRLHSILCVVDVDAPEWKEHSLSAFSSWSGRMEAKYIQIFVHPNYMFGERRKRGRDKRERGREKLYLKLYFPAIPALMHPILHCLSALQA